MTTPVTPANQEPEPTPKVVPSDGIQSDTDFDRIALALSGGGFRAAAYHLGTLRALNTLGLLDNVRMISTVSGGTIVGAYYALKRKQGVPFDTIYESFYAILYDDTLLRKALQQWEKTLAGSSSPNYKLIRAFADVYDSDLFDGATFGEFWNESDLDSFPLQTVVFNATELYSGLAFRFQHASGIDDGYLIGNRNVFVQPNDARQLRLADIVAASSCFPGGFEPLVMPDDFPRQPGEMLFYDYDNGRLPIDRLALLDGGVYDNQGTESLLIASDRNASYCEKNDIKPGDPIYDKIGPMSLLLISDVSSAGVNLYKAPEPGPSAGEGDRLESLPGKVDNWFRWAVGVAGVALGYYLLHLFVLRYPPFEGFLLGMLAGGALTVGFGLQWAVRWAIGKLNETGKPFDPIYGQATLPIRKLSIKQIVYLLTIRLTSVMTLLDTIFLRRIRSQGYAAAAAGREYKRLSSVLDRLIRAENDRDTPKQWKKELRTIQPVIEQARSMGTTLWWLNDKFRLDAIIASAELTLCYRLLRQFEERPPQPGSRSADVQQRARQLWDAYQRDPEFFRNVAVGNSPSRSAAPQPPRDTPAASPPSQG
ncbi:patatin-like phospholipase family protein [Fibrisoma montanum]|uniref:Patatin-like phospholipase family protein n=1 Tax=Fibrisoma montanum TaxID=2305895 RepID=A0A418MJ88_9BACT|nr:patatin-like phospholipase family protein [Fibrisoma montanum]RIV27480.1 patatin-like phospholipase family protein [Fibrisoma montanum]